MSNYVLINKEYLPGYLVKIINVQNEIRNGSSIFKACQDNHISRSTYYKYKDAVIYSDQKVTRRVILSLKLVDDAGVLSNVLYYIASVGGNILSINQEMPIHNIAFVMLTIDAMNISLPINKFIGEVENLNKVVNVILTAVE